MIFEVATVLILALGQPSASRSCASQLALQAAEPHRAWLQKRLAARSELQCPGAKASLSSHPTQGLVLQLSWGARRVSRSVQTLEQALAWLESWLEPAWIPAPRTRLALLPAAYVKLSGARAAAPAAIRAQVQLVGLGSLGLDADAWVGADLSGRVEVLRGLWLGAMLGASWGPAQQVGDAVTTKRALRASVRFGARLPMSARVQLVSGLGVGIISGRAQQTLSARKFTLDDSGPFGELLLDLELQLKGAWTLVAGVGARVLGASTAEHIAGAPELIGLPALAFLAKLGLGYSFGAGS